MEQQQFLVGRGKKISSEIDAAAKKHYSVGKGLFSQEQHFLQGQNNSSTRPNSALSSSTVMSPSERLRAITTWRKREEGETILGRKMLRYTFKVIKETSQLIVLIIDLTGRKVIIIMMIMAGIRLGKIILIKFSETYHNSLKQILFILCCSQTLFYR